MTQQRYKKIGKEQEKDRKSFVFRLFFVSLQSKEIRLWMY